MEENTWYTNSSSIHTLIGNSEGTKENIVQLQGYLTSLGLSSHFTIDDDVTHKTAINLIRENKTRI